MVKNLLANIGDLRDVSAIPGWGTSPGGGHSNPLQYPCLENPVDRGAWWATVHVVTKGRGRSVTTHTHTHTHTRDWFMFQASSDETHGHKRDTYSLEVKGGSPG